MSEHDTTMAEAVKAVTALNTGFQEFKATNDARLAEIEKKGSADPVLEEKLAKIEADMAKSQAIADDLALAVKRRQNAVEQPGAESPETKAAAYSRAVSRVKGFHVEIGADQMDTLKSAIDTYTRKGLDGLSQDERKALSVGGDVTGGYVVHPDMSGRIVRKVFETSPMRAYASIQAISTDALEGLFDNDEAGAEWETETVSGGETTTPDLGRWRIPVHELRARPRATQQILDDAEINMEAWLADKVAQRFARKEATAFVTGDGITKPKGFMTYANGTDLTNSIEQTNTGVNGAFAAAPNGGDVLITALYGLKAQYRANATWFMNRTTAALTRKLKDSDGAYIWSPGIAAGQPATLLGYPTAAFEDMANPATGSLSIAVGDMRAAYQIADRIGIRVLRDPYTAKPFVEFYTTKRVGGAMINGEALKIIKFAA